MIYSGKEFLERYKALHCRFEMAVNFLLNQDLESLGTGRVDIDGDNVFALVQQYETKELNGAKFEAHKKYIDIQYIVNGNEQMKFMQTERLQVTDEYDEKQDFELLIGEGSTVIVNEGEFCIFFPEDAHMPGLSNSLKQIVKKIVIKVKI